MLSKVITLAVFLSLTTTTASFAQAQSSPANRDRGDVACGGDATKLCRKVIDQGDYAVLKCFQDNRERLSNACKRFLTEMGQLN